MSRTAQFVVLVTYVGYAVGLLVTQTLAATRNPVVTFVSASIATLALVGPLVPLERYGFLSL